MRLKLIVFFLAIAITASAQSYITAGGVRIGSGIGFTFKQLIAHRFTGEAIINSSFKKDQISLVVLGERHFPLISRRFNFYMGAGLHHTWATDDASKRTTAFGPAGIVGAEMSLRKLNLSYDIKPLIFLKGDQLVNFQTAISLRYIFYRKTLKERIRENHERRKKKRQKARAKRKKERQKNSKKKKFNWRFWEKDD